MARIGSSGWYLAPLLAGVMLLGGLRLSMQETTRPGVRTFAEASAWGRCFGSSGHVSSGAVIDVSRAIDPDGPGRTGAGLRFLALEPLKVDVADVTMGKVDGTRATIPAGSVVSVSKAAGRFSMLADAQLGGLIVRHGDAVSLLEHGPARFAAADDTTYALVLSDDTPVDVGADAGRQRVALPRGTTGVVPIDTSQSVVTLQSLDVEPWLLRARHPVQSVAITAGGGLEDVVVQAQAPGGQHPSLLACVSSPSTPPVSAGPAGLRQTMVDGGVTASVPVPAGLSSAFPSFLARMDLALVDPDGGYAALGRYVTVDRWWSLFGSLALTAILFSWLLTLRQTEMRTRRDLTGDGNWSDWASGLFVGPDRDPSLSLFQVFFWTIVTVWALAYVFIATGSLLSLTPQMMALLGIAGTGSVLARWIARGRGQSTSQASGSAVTDGPAPLRFWQILSTDGEFDLLKLQVFVFSVLIGAYVILRVASTAAFPALDTNTLLLLGVSQGVYIGGKLGGASAIASAQATKVDLDLGTAELGNLTREMQDLGKRSTEVAPV